MPKGKASKLFTISRNTTDLWFERQAETGDIRPKKREFINPIQKTNALVAFHQCTEQRQDRTQAKMN